MSRTFLFRFGVAQISCNPAYADELANRIQEPTFPDKDEKVGLFSISGLDEINVLRRSIADQYIGHLNRKIESILRFAANEGVELLVFPEYSIPPESLSIAHNLSEEFNIALVAGSHVVTLNESAQQAYRDLDLTFEGGDEAAEEYVRQAASIVFVPKQKPLAFMKALKSKWETSLIKGRSPFHTFQMTTKRGRLEVQLVICIEALSSKQPKEKHTVPRLVAITASTPKISPFHDEGKRSLLQGKCTLLANVAEYGGSKVSARADNTSLWFTEKDGSKDIPARSEGLLIVEADLEKQFETRQLATEHTAVKDLRLYPLLYATDSTDCQRYSEVVDECISTVPTLEEISIQVSPFLSLNSKVFPKLLQDKLEHFTGYIASAGTVSPEEAVKWITPIVIRDTPSTNILRWDLCNQALNTINKLLLSEKYAFKAQELTEVYRHLVARRNALLASIEPKSLAAKSAEQQEIPNETGSLGPPFIDRKSAFDKIRQFFSQQQNSGFVLGGMRGIGKSTLLEEAFRQAIPPRRRIWLQLTEGMSYERLLVQLALGCDLRIPETIDLSRIAVRNKMRNRLLSYLDHGPGAVVVFDDFQVLLNPSGDIEDSAVRGLLLKLLEAGTMGRSKYFFVTHLPPKLGADFERYLAWYTLSGLQPRDTQRLLVQWLQFGRDNLTGQFPPPPDRFISILGGHPLATKLAARLWAEQPMVDIAGEFPIFKELRDTIVSFVLEKLTISPAEKELLAFASVFRIPVPREVFLIWRKEEASYLLATLACQYLIEATERGYYLHPLIQNFFKSTLSFEEARVFHRIAAKFYKDRFELMKRSNRKIVPEYLGEAVHHLLAAGNIRKARELAFFRQELRPVALEQYKREDIQLALRSYTVLLQLDEDDVEAHFHLSLIFAKLKQWGDAELHFGKALSLNPKAYWILQAFGAAKLRGGKRTEGEALLVQAEELNSRYAPTLVELGRLREKERDYVAAKDYYRRAIDSDRHNSFAYYKLAELLFREGDIQQAYRMAMAALATDPLDERNKNLVLTVKQKIVGRDPYA